MLKMLTTCQCDDKEKVLYACWQLIVVWKFA
jgi:hypothetical protein